MLDEVDALIINYIIVGKSKEMVMSVANIDEGVYDFRLEKLKKLGIDFTRIDSEIKDPQLKKKYSRIKNIDLEVFRLLKEGKTVKEVEKLLNKKISGIIKNFSNLGITFEIIVDEEKETKKILEAAVEKRKTKIAERTYLSDKLAEQLRIEEENKEKMKQAEKKARKQAQSEARKIEELSQSLRMRTLDFQENSKQLDSMVVDAIILYLLRTEKGKTGRTYTQSDIARMMGVTRQNINERVERLKRLGILVPKRQSIKDRQRDLKIYELIVEGCSNPEIMDKLKISKEQLKASVKNLRALGYKFRIANPKKQFTLDEINRVIVYARTCNQKIPVKVISEATGVAQSTIHSRIKMLKDRGYINRTTRKISERSAKSAVRQLIEKDKMPEGAVDTIAKYYGTDPEQTRKIAQYIYKEDKSDKNRE